MTVEAVQLYNNPTQFKQYQAAMEMQTKTRKNKLK